MKNTYNREVELKKALEVARKAGNKEIERSIKLKLKSKEKQNGKD